MSNSNNFIHVGGGPDNSKRKIKQGRKNWRVQNTLTEQEDGDKGLKNKPTKYSSKGFLNQDGFFFFFRMVTFFFQVYKS